MSRFKYTARDMDGQTVRGEITADSVNEFYSALRSQNLFALDFSQEKEHQEYKRQHHKMKMKELIVFCRKMGTMMSSGLSMTGAFDVLYKTAETPQLKELYLSVYENIQRGMPLSQAMRAEGRSFPPFLMNMVESGESSGNLDSILIKLATHYENENKMMNRLKSAMTYPMILLVISIGVILLMFTFVLPRMMSMFQGAEVPPLTQAVMNMSNFLVQYWPIIIGVFIVVVLIFANQRYIQPLKYAMDYMKVRFPGIRKTNRIVYSSRFGHSMSILYASGIPMLTSLRLSSNILDNLYVDKVFVSLMQNVSMGESLSSAIEATRVFDPLLASMIRIGEEAGSLDTILSSISDYYDTESSAAISKMLSILEPVMLVVLAVIIAIVLIAVMTPIYSMYSSIL